MKKIEVVLKNKSFLVLDSKQAQRLFSKRFGSFIKDEILKLNEYEVLYLIFEDKIIVKTQKENFNFEQLIKKLKIDIDKFKVFYNLRKKGYGVYSGLKYGVDFRVYDIGIRVGEDHSKWLVKVLKQNKNIRPDDIFSNNRIANTTNKILLYAFVDNDFDISYIRIGREKL